MFPIILLRLVCWVPPMVPAHGLHVWVFYRPAEPAKANRPSGKCRETDPPSQQRPTNRAANAGKPWETGIQHVYV